LARWILARKRLDYRSKNVSRWQHVKFLAAARLEALDENRQLDIILRAKDILSCAVTKVHLKAAYVGACARGIEQMITPGNLC